MFTLSTFRRRGFRASQNWLLDDQRSQPPWNGQVAPGYLYLFRRSSTMIDPWKTSSVKLDCEDIRNMFTHGSSRRSWVQLLPGTLRGPRDLRYGYASLFYSRESDMLAMKKFGIGLRRKGLERQGRRWRIKETEAITSNGIEKSPK